MVDLPSRGLALPSIATGPLLGLVGRGLRHPLAAIVGQLRSMRARTNGPWELDGLHRAVEEVLRTVDDLQDISLLADGAMSLHQRRVAVRWVLEDALELAAAVVQPRQTRVDVRIAPDDLTFIVDPERLAQAFANLLRNASTFSDVGAGVVIDVSASDSAVVVRVRDRGIGVPPERVEEIFEPFAQRSTTPGRGGLGLGLAIARSIVAEHGGSLVLRSAGVQNGTEVIVRLPSVGDGDSVGSSSGELRGVRVLVVEGNDDTADALRELLELLGSTVAVACDGARALELATRFKPEVVLLSLGLPADGYELARQLRAGASREKPPRLIAVTGYGLGETRDPWEASCFSACLVKPLSLDALVDAMRAPDAVT